MSHLDNRNHFTDCKIELPQSTHCGKVLNDIFKHGISITQFEDKYKRLAKSNFILDNTNFRSSVQYNINTDVWGPKEFVLLHKDNPDYQVGIVYGIRDAIEYHMVLDFLNKLSNAEVFDDQPANKIFRVWVPYTTWERTRELIIGVQKYTEKATMVTVLLNF